LQYLRNHKVKGIKAARAAAVLLIFIAALVCGGCDAFVKLGQFMEAVRTGTAVSGDQGVLFFGSDQLVHPREEASLTATLLSPKSLEPIKGATITFYYKGDVIGTDKTDKEGHARVRWRAPAVGTYVIEARPTALPAHIDEDYCQACKTSARLLVQACEKETEFAVIDMDYTIVADNMFQVLTHDEAAAAIKDSADVMGRIATRYEIIYLTHRPDELSRKSKQFLDSHGFPQGVLVTCPWNEAFQHSGPSKCAYLTRIKESFPNLRVGIGDQPSDVKAYLEHGMEAYMIPHFADTPKSMRVAARKVRDLPAKEHVQVVRSWKEIQEGIFDGRVFPADVFVKRLETQAAGKTQRAAISGPCSISDTQ
jgi:hypothetical protein